MEEHPEQNDSTSMGGDQGENDASPTILPGSRLEPYSVPDSVPNNIYTTVASNQETEGMYSLLEFNISQGAGSSEYINEEADESFLILEGELTIQYEEQTIVATPGDWVYIPRGHSRTFTNSGTTPVRAMSIHTFEDGAVDFQLRTQEDRDLISMAGDVYEYIAEGEHTGGQYGLMEYHTPQGAGPPLHVHNRDVEAFYVLEGQIELQMDDEVMVANPGDFINLHRFHPHVFLNSGTETLRMLEINAPSGLEKYFKAAGRRVEEIDAPVPARAVLADELAPILAGTTILEALAFSRATFSVREDGIPIVQVTVTRTGPPEGTAGATLIVSDGTANLSSDYAGNIEIPVSFADGETLQTVVIPITDDALVEENETLNLTLNNPTEGANLNLLRSKAVVTIVDNDAAPDTDNDATLTGGIGADNLTGGDGDDRIDGDRGSDTLVGLAGNDTLTGGRNRDTFVVLRGDGTDTITDFGGTGKGNNPSTAVIAQIDTLKFEGVGLTAKNLLLTPEGNNLVVSFEGVEDTEVILENFALENLDVFLPPEGTPQDAVNIMFTGQVEFVDSFDVFNANQQLATVFNIDTVTFLNELNNTTSGFSYSHDVINGQGGDDQLEGLSGDDLLRGGSGNDTLVGGANFDTLIGGEGNDLLRGGSGNDVLTGGAGIDTLTGGSGSDLFVLASETSTDTITDFTDGRDLFKLSDDLVFAALTITQGTDTRVNDTLISLTSTNAPLAFLTGVQASSITSTDFGIV